MFKLKDITEEDSREFSEGVVDPKKFHRRFYILLWVFQVLDAPIPKWTHFSMAFTAMCPLIALAILSLGLYHGLMIMDLTFMTEVGTYCIVMSYKLLIMSCTRLNVKNYHHLQRTLQEDFLYACTKGEKYRNRFFFNQVQTRKLCDLGIIFTCGIATIMMLFATACLVFHLITNAEGKRPLLFPFWAFDVDFGATPTYEAALIFAFLCITAYAINYTFMIVTEIMWISEIATKADIINWCIQDLMEGIRPANNKTEREYFDAVLKHRLRKIVKHYHSMDMLMEHYVAVYKKLLMFEQKVSAPVVCLSAYSASVKMDQGDYVILLLLCVAATTLLFIPSYMVTFVSSKIGSICYTCWDIPFWDAGPVVRPYLVLMMQKSLRPLPLKAPGFEEVSVQTFSNKMASAYSMFNMLRQAGV